MARIVSCVQKNADAPVTTAAVRAALGFGTAFSDDTVRSLIDRAVGFVEGETGLLIQRGAYRADFDGFPLNEGALRIPGLNASITVITYLDSAGATMELAAAEFNALEIHRSKALKIYPSAVEGTWPALPIQRNSLPTATVRFNAGADPGFAPAELETAIMHGIRWLYDESMASRQIVRDITAQYLFEGA